MKAEVEAEVEEEPKNSQEIEGDDEVREGPFYTLNMGFLTAPGFGSHGWTGPTTEREREREESQS